MIWTLKGLIDSINSTTAYINGKWVPSRPLRAGFFYRLRAAWDVLTDKADAVIWPEGQ